MSEQEQSFGPFAFNRLSHELSRDGQPVALGARSAAILDALLALQGQVVERAALLDAAWPGLAVEDGNLAVQVARLRRTLGTRPDGQEWIATVPRVGYRLLPDVPRDAPAQSAGIPSMVVLPFTNLGADPGQDYLADGIADDLITGLSRFHSFAVIARNSSFTYKGRAVDVRQVASTVKAGCATPASTALATTTSPVRSR